MFGSTREEISGPAEFSMFNFHAECEMPPASEFKNMAMKAEAKFDKILAMSVEGTQRNGGGVRKQLANRLAFRFNEGPCSNLKFDLSNLLFIGYDSWFMTQFPKKIY